MILLLGAEPEEPGLAGFAAHLRRRAVPHAVVGDPARLGFGVGLDDRGRSTVRLHIPGHGTLPGDEVAVFVRDPWTYAQAGAAESGPPDGPGGDARFASNGDARFAAKEYHAALWTLCALLPGVVNRPGPQAWQYDPVLRAALDPAALLPEYWTTDPAALLGRWAADGTPELHVEDLLTRERRILTDPGPPLRSGTEPGSAHLRAVFAPSSRYAIVLYVGRRSFTVLDETGTDLGAEPHRTFLDGLADTLRRYGIRFAAAALVVRERRLAVSRILTDPPYAWYRARAEEVHEALHAELCRPFPADGEAVR
ncbi:hypothetical protein ACWDR0_08145 [Streptomyces sp. NPDC003691]